MIGASQSQKTFGPAVIRANTRWRWPTISPASAPPLATKSLKQAVLLLAPFGILFVIFQLGPIAVALYNSFLEFSIIGTPEGWAGIDNYRSVLSNGEFQASLVLTTLFIIVKVLLQIVIGLAIALALVRQNWFNAVIRSVVFLPTATAIVAVTLMFSFLFDRELGLINAILDVLGLARVDWLLEPLPAQTVMLTISLWRDTGFVMLVFLAGLQAVPNSLLEAARIDGASFSQEIRYITVPLLIRSFQFAAVFATLACARFVAPIAILTQGGPQQSTDVAAFYIYQQAFTFFAWAETSAMSVVLLGLLLVITFSLTSALRARWEY